MVYSICTRVSAQAALCSSVHGCSTQYKHETKNPTSDFFRPLENIIIDGTDDTIEIEEPLDVSRLKLSRSFGVVQLFHTLRASTQIVKYTSHNDTGRAAALHQ
mgnify:CR=1 FL=1